MKYYIKQILKNDCGFACLKMYLSYLYKDTSYLFLAQTLVDKEYSLYDIINIAKYNGVGLKAYSFDDKNLLLEKIKRPFLAIIKVDNKKHMVFIRKVFLNFLVIFDPDRGVYVLSKNKFLKIWDTNILVFDKFKNSCIKHSRMNISGSKTCYFFSIFFELISSSFLVVGISLLNYERYFHLVILFGILFLLFAGLSKIIINHNSKYINNKILNIIKEKSEIKVSKEFIELLTKYKYGGLNYYVSLFSSVLSLILISVIISLNVFINLYFVFLTVIIYFVLKISFYPLIKKIENQINKIENTFTGKSENNVLSFALSDLQKKSDMLFKVLIIKKYIFYVSLFILVIGVCFLNNTFTLNFGFFYLIVYSIVFNLVEKIDTFKSKIKSEKEIKCKLVSLIKS